MKITGKAILLSVLALALASCNTFAPKPTGMPTPTETSLPTPIATLSPTFTATIESPIVTEAPTITENNPSCEGVTDPKGGTMCLVTAGEFTMGSENGNRDEKPVHQVHLDAFYMDEFEVTNALYKACVDVGVCAPPYEEGSTTHSSYYSNLEYANYPVIKVDWNQANTFCGWRGARLPTEAEWEKAARGTDERTYPWGSSIDCSFANYWGKDGGCVGDTSEVGSYPSGVSAYGIFDLAGNVWEWVADWYGDTYYSSSPSSNPMGSSSGGFRALRGGSWGIDGLNARASIRYWGAPDDWDVDFGFRCVRGTSP